MNIIYKHILTIVISIINKVLNLGNKVLINFNIVENFGNGEQVRIIN